MALFYSSLSVLFRHSPLLPLSGAYWEIHTGFNRRRAQYFSLSHYKLAGIFFHSSAVRFRLKRGKEESRVEAYAAISLVLPRNGILDIRFLKSTLWTVVFSLPRRRSIARIDR